MPTLPPAPGLLSTTIGCPKILDIFSKTTRLTTSLALPPANGTIEVGGPEKFHLDELVARVLEYDKDPRKVVVDPDARYSGVKLSENSLIPSEDAKLGFEFFPADGKRAKVRDPEADEENEEEPETALIEAAPRKALPGPKDKLPPRSPPSSSGTVPSVPPKKE